MSSIAEADTTRLLASVDVAALVGSRVYRAVAPEDSTFPFVIIRVMSQKPDITQAGASGLFECVHEYHCYAETGSQLETLVEEIEQCLWNEEYEEDENGFQINTAHEMERVDAPYSNEFKVYGIGVSARFWASAPTS